MYALCLSRSRAVVAAAALVMALPAVSAIAATPLDTVKDLYAAASYEAALQALDNAGAASSLPAEAQEYRVLLLLALGRSAEAQRAADALVTAAPTRVPSAEEFPPRYVSLVQETRRRLLPSLVLQAFADAREQYRAVDHGDAAARFERVLALAADPGVADVAEVKDVRTLAAGFLDLLQAKTVTAAPPAARPAASRPAAAATVAGTARPAVTQPSIPIRQVLPAWSGTDRTRLSRDLHGSVALVIGADGHVKRATMKQPIHPMYDALLLDAARDWTYKPATLNGEPVESERVLEVDLKRE